MKLLPENLLCHPFLIKGACNFKKSDSTAENQQSSHAISLLPCFIGQQYKRINDTIFWLNYIEYQINQGHIEVIYHDCTELADSLNGEVEIYSDITIDETTYPVRVIDCWTYYYSIHSCSNLKKITIPNSVVTLKAYDRYYSIGTFQDCSNLEDVLLSNNLTCLPDRCFYGCSSLEKITLSDNLTSLGNYCFSDCSSLKKITLPDNLTTIGEYCFSGCSSLERIALPDNVTALNGSCFSDCNSLKEVTLPDNLKRIGSNCFYNCSELKKLSIPGSVTSIGGSCFSGCNSLTRLSFAETVPQMSSKTGYPTDIRSLISFGDKLWIYQNENKKLYTTIVDPEEFNALIYEMYSKGVFSSFCNYSEWWWSLYYLCRMFFTIYVPQSALSAYRSYSSELSPWFEGYDPATFDFEALLAD